MPSEEMISAKKRVCIVVSSEMTVRAFLLDHIAALMRSYDVTVIANTANTNFLAEAGLRAPVLSVAIVRKIAPVSDLKALMSLYAIFRKGRFDVVHSITPKAGLLAMAAAFLARVPHRVHTFTGQVWATGSGLRRGFLKTMDVLLAALATNVLVDSASQRDFLIKEGVLPARKAAVPASGSISGVDAERFRPDEKAGLEVRKSFGIDPDAVVLLFVGRLNRDKGILDLARAFAELAQLRLRLHLLFVGPDEEGMRRMVKEMSNNVLSRLHFVDFTASPEAYMAAADIFCLPSYREGFGSVIIEAAAAGVPSIGSRIYGISDAIEENDTGLLFAPGNVEELKERILRFLDQPDLRRAMGARARQRAVALFSKEKVTAALMDYYEKMLK